MNQAQAQKESKIERMARVGDAIVPYDVCCERRMNKPELYRFVGTGSIYSINGVVQGEQRRLCFYQRTGQ